MDVSLPSQVQTEVHCMQRMDAVATAAACCGRRNALLCHCPSTINMLLGSPVLTLLPWACRGLELLLDRSDEGHQQQLRRVQHHSWGSYLSAEPCQPREDVPQHKGQLRPLVRSSLGELLCAKDKMHAMPWHQYAPACGTLQALAPAIVPRL